MLMARMNTSGLLAVLARRAPATATAKLIRSILLEPSLSDSSPVGIVKIAWQRGGIAAMIPSCFRDRLNSSLRSEKMAVWIPPKTCVSTWVTVITTRP